MRIFHHEGEKIAEHHILQVIEIDIARPDIVRKFSIALHISIDPIFQ